ncbi:MAG: uroporphyrinogen decarboxylase family protein [bacterium]
MNSKERFRKTLLFQETDKVPLNPGGPRESTLEAWHQQGLPEEVNWKEYLWDLLGIEKNFPQSRVGIGVSFKMIPTFEEKVLEHKDGHYIVQDWMGAITEISDEYDYTYIRRAKDFVTRKWHKFPVEDREDWKENVKWRYDPEDDRRFPDDFEERCEKLNQADYPITFKFNGPFWQVREWVGMENLCMMMIDDPDFVKDMIEFWTDFVSKTMEPILNNINVDAVMVGEDMAFKAHSMISPEMVREFLKPAYDVWVPQIKKSGCPIVDMDSDGYIENLIPIWIESGFNSCVPIEVAAGNDLVKFRKKFGKKMAYRGGIDKRAIAAGGDTMKEEVMRVVPPLLEDGGYIPGCDHGVPPDISWPNFVEYTELLAKLTGWL